MQQINLMELTVKTLLLLSLLAAILSSAKEALLFFPFQSSSYSYVNNALSLPKRKM